MIFFAYFPLKIVAAFLLLQTLDSVANAGRLEFKTFSPTYPKLREYDSKGTGCTDIGPNMFAPSLSEAVYVKASLDREGRCYSCIIYSKDNCAGASFNVTCGGGGRFKEIPLKITRAESFKCSDPCSGCRK